ncbi:HEAT repeat domain-containing protein, partial [Actinoplanes octamycinicus]
MLDDLATVDWAALTHRHGPAADVPELLRSVAEGDSDALDTLEERLVRVAGGVYPATSPAVPFLVRILDMPAARTEAVLGSLARLLDGDEHDHPHDPGAAEATRAAVVAGLPSYLRLLAAHPDEGVRSAAAHLIGVLGPEVAGGASAALRQASVVDRSELVRTAAVRALGSRGDTADDRLADPSPMVRLVAAIALSDADPAAPLPGPVVQILERDAVAALDVIERTQYADRPLTWVLEELAPRYELQVRLVTGWLRHPSAAIRRAAAQAVSTPLRTWPPAAAMLVGPLAEAVDDPDERVRGEVAERLASAGSAAA